MKKSVYVNSFSLVRETTNLYNKKLTSSHLASEFCRNLFEKSINIFEMFFCVYLDNSKNVIGYAKIGQGGLTSTVADPRLVFKYGIESLCTSIIVVHNHPSGNLSPSEADIKLIRNLKEAGEKYLSIELTDALILSDSGYYSFADEGRI